jgi:hypothetical protein
VFAYIPVGSYDVNVQEPGWVTPTGVNDVHASGNVSNGTTNTTTIVYDVAGTVTVNMRTKAYDPTQNKIVDTPSRAYSYSLANAGVTATGFRQFLPTVAPASTIVATQLFPFKDSYGIYAGRCLSENPTTSNGGATQVVDRAGIYTVDAYQPALRIRVVNGTAAVVGARVVASLEDYCVTGDPGDKIPAIRTDALGGLTTEANGYVTRPSVAGIGFDPGIPYGIWDICVDNGTRYKILQDYANTTIAGAATTTTINMNTGTALGTCA